MPFFGEQLIYNICITIYSTALLFWPKTLDLRKSNAHCGGPYDTRRPASYTVGKNKKTSPAQASAIISKISIGVYSSAYYLQKSSH